MASGRRRELLKARDAWLFAEQQGYGLPDFPEATRLFWAVAIVETGELQLWLSGRNCHPKSSSISQPFRLSAASSARLSPFSSLRLLVAFLPCPLHPKMLKTLVPRAGRSLLSTKAPQLGPANLRAAPSYQIVSQNQPRRRGYASEASEYDVLFIGGGVAGYVGAIKAGQEGLKVSTYCLPWNTSQT